MPNFDIEFEWNIVFHTSKSTTTVDFEGTVQEMESFVHGLHRVLDNSVTIITRKQTIDFPVTVDTLYNKLGEDNG